jgi:hypothetical protein
MFWVVFAIVLIGGLVISYKIYESDEGSGYFGNTFGVLFAFIALIFTLAICGALLLGKYLN